MSTIVTSSGNKVQRIAPLKEKTRLFTHPYLQYKAQLESLTTTREELLSSSICNQQPGEVLCFLWTLETGATVKVELRCCVSQVVFYTILTFDKVKLPIAESFRGAHSNTDHTVFIFHFHNHLSGQTDRAA